MNKIVRFYNQNRKKIFIIGIIILFLFSLLQLLNNISKERIENENKNININTANKIENGDVLISDKSISNGKKLSDLKLNEEIDIIKRFVGFCNDKNLEEAYNLLLMNVKRKCFQM